PRKRPADFRLKQDNESDGYVRQHRREQPFDHFQTRPLRAAVKNEQQRHSHQHLHRAGPAQQFQQIIDQRRDDQNVQSSPEIQARQRGHRKRGGEHGGPIYGIPALLSGASRSLPRFVRIQGCAMLKLAGICRSKTSKSRRDPTLLNASSRRRSSSPFCTLPRMSWSRCCSQYCLPIFLIRSLASWRASIFRALSGRWLCFWRSRRWSADWVTWSRTERTNFSPTGRATAQSCAT